MKSCEDWESKACLTPLKSPRRYAGPPHPHVRKQVNRRETRSTIDWETQQVARSAQAVADWHWAHPVSHPTDGTDEAAWRPASGWNDGTATPCGS